MVSHKILTLLYQSFLPNALTCKVEHLAGFGFDLKFAYLFSRKHLAHPIHYVYTSKAKSAIGRLFHTKFIKLEGLVGLLCTVKIEANSFKGPVVNPEPKNASSTILEDVCRQFSTPLVKTPLSSFITIQ